MIEKAYWKDIVKDWHSPYSLFSYFNFAYNFDLLYCKRFMERTKLV